VIARGVAGHDAHHLALKVVLAVPAVSVGDHQVQPRTRDGSRLALRRCGEVRRDRLHDPALRGRGAFRQGPAAIVGQLVDDRPRLGEVGDGGVDAGLAGEVT
jgi:hypothetical protein